MVKMQHATYLCTKKCKFTTGLHCDYHKLSQKIEINCLKKKLKIKSYSELHSATILQYRNSSISTSIYRQSMQYFRVLTC